MKLKNFLDTGKRVVKINHEWKLPAKEPHTSILKSKQKMKKYKSVGNLLRDSVHPDPASRGNQSVESN